MVTESSNFWAIMGRDSVGRENDSTLTRDEDRWRHD